ncbi:MAG: FAD-dependent 2-octaprenylphenol hydroxylase [Gammaproteobacteria bacterium]
MATANITTTITHTPYDIIVVGGGIVGLTCANALLHAAPTSKIALVEGGSLTSQWQAEHYDLRVSAITRASQNILTNLQAWSHIENTRLNPYHHMLVWDTYGRIQFNAAELNQTDLGHIIENSAIVDALHQSLRRHNNVTFYLNNLLQQMQVHADHVTVTLTDATQLQAKLVIAADGAHSWIREHARFEVNSRDYWHYALVATVKTEKSHNQTAMQRFFDSQSIFKAGGTLAFLPLNDPHFCSIVWASDPHRIVEMQQTDTKTCQAMLTQLFDAHLGEVELVSQRVVFPLKMRHAVDYVKPRIALIGDAAHTIHPLAGQGVNLGILDATVLAQVLSPLLQQRADIGELATLKRYQRWRKLHNTSMVKAMTGFKQLFGSSQPLVRHLRGLGLNLVDHLPPVKQLFMQQALGLMPDLPKLALPQ